MEIRLLGPVEVVVGEHAVPVPGSGERELLALLALSAGRVVAVPTLVDSLWGEDLPANPGNALQVRVSKLRRTMNALGVPSSIVITRPPGYLLDIEPRQVDALGFAVVVAEARAAAGGDPSNAADRYRRALSRWRGAALSEFRETRWAGPEAARLMELQLAAQEELIDLEMAAGRHTDVLGELEALTTAHPLRERLHGRLMLALYRAGRQADALAVYQRTRALLDSELGLEPSAELRGLQKAILDQRPDLRAPNRITPARPAPPPGHRLPPRLTSFLGRDDDAERVSALIRDHRLVTVTGPGGVGKTSLAVEVARAATDGFSDGVGFVRLAGLAEEEQVPLAVLAALDVRDVPTATAEDQMLGHLRDREVLLILDNCEHLADACAVLAERLLESCPRLRLLATSREPLAARGEVQASLEPFPVPPADADRSDLGTSTAVRLFVERAQSALPDFRLAEQNAAAVAEICRRLDGIPLALELAAARVAALPVTELAARMEDRFALLTTGPRTAEMRQRTLRSTVDWSYQLLSEPERMLLRRLSVFRGGWTLTAVQSVAGGQGLNPGIVVDTLARLVDRSLVVVDRNSGPRYHLLETIREYAIERLQEASESDIVGRAHVQYLTALAQQAERELRGNGQARWLPRLSMERDDIESGLAWCTAHTASDPDAGLLLVGALGWYWYFASRPDGGGKVAAMLEAAPGGSPSARAHALQALAVAGRPGACIVHPAPECATAAAESRTLFVQLGDDSRAALSATLLAVEDIGADDPEHAFGLLADADQEFHRTDDDWCSALAQFVRMELHAAAGEMVDATLCGERALAVFRALGDQWGASAIQFHLGVALHRAGQLDEALSMYEGALGSGRQVGQANTIQYALAGAGHVTLQLGDGERAARLFAESHKVGRELGADGNARAAVGEGLLARERGDLTEAGAKLTWALHRFAEQSEPAWTSATLIGLGHLGELSGNLDSAEFCHRRAWQTAPGDAAALEGLACVAAARADAATAARLLGTASWWRNRRHRPIARLERVDVQRAENRARALLGDDSYEAAYRAGADEPHALTPELGAAPAGH
ncbi:Predicted ATPase [Blastococcus aurantiacus]|uniref:Predicted ATPase n=1 Tax=Blastococcus aurantiacus TaxID=1550231 RepID=A0A1G7R3A2_9ACTN|nr:BTAD domain-containing putative transcriptional regulator [Blastococcus aurantiacus]SDG05243.1 Predicted ATPase [Blastococcus aurantiacus]